MTRSARLLLPFVVAVWAGCAQTVQPLPPRPVTLPNDAGTEEPRIEAASIQIIGRKNWARAGPVLGRIKPMGRISRITIHHDARVSYETSWSLVAARIRAIQQGHLRRRDRLGRPWGDIGYHFLIDYNGRIWEGRSLSYQGAHALDNNDGNVGVVLLGNFNKQRPSDGQKKSLKRLVDYLMSTYRVSKRNLYTHRELKATQCPGRFLQAYVEQMRR